MTRFMAGFPDHDIKSERDPNGPFALPRSSPALRLMRTDCQLQRCREESVTTPLTFAQPSSPAFTFRYHPPALARPKLLPAQSPRTSKPLLPSLVSGDALWQPDLSQNSSR